MAMKKNKIPNPDPSRPAVASPPPPSDPAEELELSHILDVPAIQSMMDNFHALTGFSMAIVDLGGKVLVSAGWQDICTKFHRVHPETCRHCLASDTVLSAGTQPGAFKQYQCQNHMWDMATPIFVGDRHEGNLFLGQFFFDDEPPNREVFRAQARQYGFDETEYLAALDRVPRWSRHKVDQAMTFYTQFAQQLSELGYRNLQLARALAEQKRTEELLQQQKNLIGSILESSTEAIFAKDAKGRYISINSAGARMLGRHPDEVVGRTDQDLLSAETAREFCQTDKQVMASGAPSSRDEAGEIDGQKRIFLAHKTPWRDHSGKIAGVIGVSSDITERKQAAERLRESEALYRSILDASPDDITITDLQGKLLIVSPSALTIYGFEHEDQMIGRNLLEFIVPEERERALADIARLHQGLSAGRIGYRGEYRGLRADGSVFDIEVNGEFIRDEAGQPSRMILIVRDVTDRKQTENHLRTQARLLDAVQESVVATDLEGRIQYWGRGAERLYGYSAEEVLGKSYRNFAGSIAIADEDAFRREVLTQGFWRGEHLQRNRTGETFWTSTFISPVADEHGQPVGFIGIDQDITERKRAEMALRESESRFRNIAELLPDAIFEMDRNGGISFANKRAFDLLGYSQADVERGVNAFDAISPAERAQAQARLALRLTGTNTGAREYTAVRKDGSTFPAILNLSPKMKEGEPTGFLGAMTDITALKQAEMALQASERRYRTFINATSDLVFLKDDAFRYLISNRANSAFLGKPEEAVIGRTDFDLMPKGSATCCRESDLAVVQKGESLSFEEGIHDKIYQTVKFPVPLPDGRFGVGGFIRDITERKQIEESLRASEARHRDIATNIPGVVYQLQVNRVGSFEVPYMSAGCEALFEHPLEDLNYSDLLFDHMHIGDRALFQHSLVTAAKDMERWNLEFRILPAKDQIKWLRGSANPRRLPNGNVVWNGVLLDITDLKQAEQALLEREAFQNLLMDTIPSPVFYKDRKGRYLGVNKAFEALIGKTKAYLIGKTTAEIDFPELPEISRAKDLELIEQPGLQVYETQILDAKGDRRDLVFHKASLIDAQGAVAGLIGVILDITDRKQVERTLKESEERFQQVAETAGEWIWELDADGMYTYSSPVVERILGYKPEELVGKMHFHELFDPQVREDIRKAADQRTARKEGFQRLSNPVLHKDGHLVILETTGMPVLNPDGHLVGYRGADTDITNRRQAEDQLARQLDELRRWQTVTLGRESRVAELKREVNALATRLGQQPPYDSAVTP